MLVQDFMQSKTSAITVKALLGEYKVVAIVDTRSSGVIVSETWIQRLNFSPDEEVKFSVTSATNSKKEKL